VVQKDQKVLQVQQALLAHKVLLEHKVLKDLLAFLVFQLMRQTMAKCMYDNLGLGLPLLFHRSFQCRNIRR
jgi:hypothetical protein